jgi:hypothetical protein
MAVNEEELKKAEQFVQLRDSALGDHAPCLEAAILNWHAARHAYQNEPSKSLRDVYSKRTFQLGLSISRWQAQQPELVQQFGYWFDSHREVWSVQESDGASEL